MTTAIKLEHRGLVCTICSLSPAVYLTPWPEVLVCDDNDCIVDAFRENVEKIPSLKNHLYQKIP